MVFQSNNKASLSELADDVLDELYELIQYEPNLSTSEALSLYSVAADIHCEVQSMIQTKHIIDEFHLQIVTSHIIAERILQRIQDMDVPIRSIFNC